jgi:hypothetical protein
MKSANNKQSPPRSEHETPLLQLLPYCRPLGSYHSLVIWTNSRLFVHVLGQLYINLEPETDVIVYSA